MRNDKNTKWTRLENETVTPKVDSFLKLIFQINPIGMSQYNAFEWLELAKGFIKTTLLLLLLLLLLCSLFKFSYVHSFIQIPVNIDNIYILTDYDKYVSYKHIACFCIAEMRLT